MIALIIILAILVFVLMLPFKVQIKYLLYKKTNRLTVKIGLLYPFISTFDSAKKKNGKKAEGGGKDGASKSKINLSLLCDVFREVAALFDYFKKKLKITTLRLHFHIGASDAAATGIITGSAWGALYDMAAVLDNHFVLCDKNIHVAPDFTEEIFETDIEVELSIKVFNMVFFALRTYKSIKKLDIFKRERNEI